MSNFDSYDIWRPPQVDATMTAATPPNPWLRLTLAIWSLTALAGAGVLAFDARLRALPNMDWDAHQQARAVGWNTLLVHLFATLLVVALHRVARPRRHHPDYVIPIVGFFVLIGAAVVLFVATWDLGTYRCLQWRGGFMDRECYDRYWPSPLEWVAGKVSTVAGLDLIVTALGIPLGALLRVIGALLRKIASLDAPHPPPREP